MHTYIHTYKKFPPNTLIRIGALPPVMEEDYPGSYDDNEMNENEIDVISTIEHDHPSNSNDYNREIRNGENSKNNDYRNGDNFDSNSVNRIYDNKKMTGSTVDKEVVKEMLVS